MQKTAATSSSQYATSASKKLKLKDAQIASTETLSVGIVVCLFLASTTNARAALLGQMSVVHAPAIITQTVLSSSLPNQCQNARANAEAGTVAVGQYLRPIVPTAAALTFPPALLADISSTVFWPSSGGLLQA